jgi:pantothenate kinase-related protein Tda10
MAGKPIPADLEIHIVGPHGSGKTCIAAVLHDLLRREFGTTVSVLDPDLNNCVTYRDRERANKAVARGAFEGKHVIIRTSQIQRRTTTTKG